ncbi:MAG: ATP-binding protein [Lachnospiraceae bacterium]|nr:ATP-binding protein [Lachnospiraceae bacterium]
MALNNSQYDVVMRIYDQRRFQNNHSRELRIAEVYDKVPRIKELESAISSSAVRRAKELIFAGGDENELTRQLADTMDNLIKEKNDLLISNGFDEDYMELRYQCPHCKDTGYVGDTKCSCFKQAVIDMLYTQSNLKQILSTENFDTFNAEYYDNTTPHPITGQTPYQNIQKIHSTCVRFVEEFTESPNNLLFYGESGTGKTFMTNCIAKELIEQSHSVIYLTAISLFDLFEKQAFGTDYDDALSTKDLEQYLFDSELLIIDDLGTESMNSFTNSKLFYCLNERLLRGKSTIISTNLTLEALTSLYSERISSRIISNYTLLKFYGDDIRMKKKLSHC